MDLKEKIIDNTTYSIGKDIDGKEHTTEDLHQIILKIVLEIDRVCRKNNVPYALGFGSALGLVNYGGFIPWDDDADIVIDYFDIPRFIEACQKDLSDEFVLEGYEINKKANVLVPTLKMRYKNSYLKEENWFWLPNRCGTGSGFFVDICAFMGVPEDKKEHKKLLRKGKAAVVPYCFLDALLRIHPYHLKKKLKDYERQIAEKYKDSPYVSQSVIIPWQELDDIHANSFKREVIYPFKEFDFAGHKLFSFNQPDVFASLRYGEKSLRIKKDGQWVDTYPKEKRFSKHLGAYSLNRSIK